jgi:hypothetical protein
MEQPALLQAAMISISALREVRCEVRLEWRNMQRPAFFDEGVNVTRLVWVYVGLAVGGIVGVGCVDN